MTTFAIDNTPVSVTLNDNETYTPASGSVQKLKIACRVDEGLSINGLQIIDNYTGNGEPNVDEITVIASDITTIETDGAGSGAVHVSGFEVN